MIVTVGALDSDLTLWIHGSLSCVGLFAALLLLLEFLFSYYLLAFSVLIYQIACIVLSRNAPMPNNLQPPSVRSSEEFLSPESFLL